METIRKMCVPEEITIELAINNVDNQSFDIDGQELTFLASTFDEIEKKIYN